MLQTILVSLLLSFNGTQVVDGGLDPHEDLTGIRIINVQNLSRPRGTFSGVDGMPIPTGKNFGGVINAHYHPALKSYALGLYSDAEDDLQYFLRSRSYTDENPDQARYLSTSHYLRGMIYFYHAEGLGRLTVAKKSFETSIRLNPANHPAYLELAKVYVQVGLQDVAVSVLESLLKRDPDAALRQQAEAQLKNLKSPPSHR